MERQAISRVHRSLLGLFSRSLLQLEEQAVARVLQCVAVCCSVLQCVAVCCTFSRVSFRICRSLL